MQGWMLVSLELTAIVVLVACSAFFSSAEMSLFSLSRAKVLSFEHDPSASRRRIFTLMSSCNRTLVTIILSNMFVNSLISMLNDSVTDQVGLSGVSGEIVSALTAILILLLFGEITPMTLAYAYCDRWSGIAATPVAMLRTVLTPVTFLVEKFTGKILDLLGRASPDPLTQEEYETYLNDCAGRGAFSSGETDFLKEALDFTELRVTEIMLPRISLAFVRKTDSAEAVTETIRSSRRLYLPVGERSPDDAESVLCVRDFFSLSAAERNGWLHSKAVRPAVFLPENASVMLAFRELRKTGERAALVPDEYGGIAGMVSREIICSRLTAQTLFYRSVAAFPPKKAGRDWIFDGLTPPDVAADIAGCPFDDSGTEANTLNGLVSEKLGAVPAAGDTVTAGGMILTVEEVRGLRASKIRLSPNPGALPGKRPDAEFSIRS